MDRDNVRQEIHIAMRKATRLSKRAIFLVHRNQLDDAVKTLRRAGDILAGLDNLSESFPDLLYMGSVDAAFQEYTEAQILFGLVTKKRFVNHQDINVPPSSYVLGLADVIGELRRRALDLLREGKSKRAEECMDYMETIYAELTNLDSIQMLIPGLRRKCDVGRRVIEATRGDLTIDARRSLLESSIRELRKTLEAQSKE